MNRGPLVRHGRQLHPPARNPAPRPLRLPAARQRRARILCATVLVVCAWLLVRRVPARVRAALTLLPLKAVDKCILLLCRKYAAGIDLAARAGLIAPVRPDVCGQIQHTMSVSRPILRAQLEYLYSIF